MTDIDAKVERLIAAIEWIARHRTGDASQQHDLLAVLNGIEWEKEHPTFERSDGG